MSGGGSAGMQPPIQSRVKGSGKVPTSTSGICSGCECVKLKSVQSPLSPVGKLFKSQVTI